MPSVRGKALEEESDAFFRAFEATGVVEGRPALPVVLLDDGVGVGLDERLEDGGDGAATCACVVQGREAVVAFVRCVVGLGCGEGLDAAPVGDARLVVDD